jgi:hypothetical protein
MSGVSKNDGDDVDGDGRTHDALYQIMSSVPIFAARRGCQGRYMFSVFGKERRAHDRAAERLSTLFLLR